MQKQFMQISTFMKMSATRNYTRCFYMVMLCTGIIALHLNGTAQLRPFAKDNTPARHFTNVLFKDSVAARPTYKYVYSAPKSELMRWPNYPLTSAQIEQRQKLEESRKILPKVGESVVESWINSKKKKKVAVIPAF